MYAKPDVLHPVLLGAHLQHESLWVCSRACCSTVGSGNAQQHCQDTAGGGVDRGGCHSPLRLQHSIVWMQEWMVFLWEEFTAMLWVVARNYPAGGSGGLVEGKPTLLT